MLKLVNGVAHKRSRDTVSADKKDPVTRYDQFKMSLVKVVRTIRSQNFRLSPFIRKGAIIG